MKSPLDAHLRAVVGFKGVQLGLALFSEAIAEGKRLRFCG